MILFVRLLIACSNLGATQLDLTGSENLSTNGANSLCIHKKTISAPVLLQAFSVALTSDSYGPSVSNLEHLSLNGLVCKRRPTRNCYLDRLAITPGYSELGN